VTNNTKTLLFFWIISITVLIIGINLIDGWPVVDDWLPYITGLWVITLVFTLISLVLSYLLSWFNTKANKDRKAKVVSVFPYTMLFLTIISLFAYALSRPSYSRVVIPENLDCTLIKDGKFRLNEYLIERLGDLQTETNTTTNEKYKFKVNWLSNCEYELINPKNPKDISKVKIVSINDESYECYISGEGRTVKYKIDILKGSN
jgi:hypothetical protein